MNKKIIFLDLDNTLYCHDIYNVPQSAVKAIQLAKTNGHKIILCTGRNPTMGRIVDYSLFDGLIFSSGAYVRVENKVLFESYFTHELINEVISFYERGEVELNLETPEAVYLSEVTFNIYSNNQHRDISPEADVCTIESLREICTYQNQFVSKISIYLRNEEFINEIKNRLNNEVTLYQMGKRDNLSVYEICQNDINKAKGIQVVLDYYGFSVEDAIAIGDSMNDLEMLQHCGIGICVESGDSNLKKIADDICPAPLKDGIKKAFVKYGLIDI